MEPMASPKDLVAVAEEAELEDSYGGFPSRPCVLPDEMRGALLLPSDSGSSYGSRQTAGDESLQSSSLPEGQSSISGWLQPQPHIGADEMMAGGGSQQSATLGASGVSDGSDLSFGVGGSGIALDVSLAEMAGGLQAHPSVPLGGIEDATRMSKCLDRSPSQASRSDSKSGSNPSPVPSSGVGLGGAHDPTGCGGSPRHDEQSRDWSISDPDLQELLTGPGQLGAASPPGKLTSVPEGSPARSTATLGNSPPTASSRGTAYTTHWSSNSTVPKSLTTPSSTGTEAPSLSLPLELGVPISEEELAEADASVLLNRRANSKS